MKKHTIFIIATVFLNCSLVVGQTQYEVLWSFNGSPNDGASPFGSFVLDRGGNLYGTTAGGGLTAGCSTGCGTVLRFSPNSDGSWNETVLYRFCTNFTNNQCQDGAFPRAGLVFDTRGNLYGTTYSGGSNSCHFLGPGGCGAVFELSPPSSPSGTWKETVLYSFCANFNNNTCLDGALPTSQLVFDAVGNLYGTTTTGGTAGLSGVCCVGGTVFELSPGTSGWTETVLHSFCATGHGNVCPDGAGPQAGLTFDSSGNLYGTTESGGTTGSAGGGTVFKLSPGPNGWTESVLQSSGPPYSSGAIPLGAVSFDPLGNLYTTFSLFGLNGGGGVMRLGPRGGASEFSFNGSDGDKPLAGVFVDSRNGAIYGTTASGGSAFGGTVFQISAPADETVLYSFCSQPNYTDGVQPWSAVIADKSGNLYGTTKFGGTNNFGVVFEIVRAATPKRESKRFVWHTILPGNRN